MMEKLTSNGKDFQESLNQMRYQILEFDIH